MIYIHVLPVKLNCVMSDWKQKSIGLWRKNVRTTLSPKSTVWDDRARREDKPTAVTLTAVEEMEEEEEEEMKEGEE